MRYPGQNEMIWGLWSNKLYESLFQEFMTDPTASQNIMFVRPDAMSMYQDVNWSSENTIIVGTFLQDRGKRYPFCPSTRRRPE